ncbi:DUF2141 domain-containing protein [Winogradskyella litorisediminis]|uniref:DUF2141 domain-containing protein n=1 Tax=Winogradskyella litorisediminis TaxID=1156618 RepID=A0ABW3N928_9FLAO
MTTIVRLLIFLLLQGNISNAQTNDTHDITVHVSGLKNNKGKLLVGLYNSENQFLSERYKDIEGKINNQKSTFVFKDIPTGIYAISFIHDKNDNGKLDTNFMGIPREDYGCSNNAKGFMGPPKWKDAKFELTDDKTITISL